MVRRPLSGPVQSGPVRSEWNFRSALIIGNSLSEDQGFTTPEYYLLTTRNLYIAVTASKG